MSASTTRMRTPATRKRRRLYAVIAGLTMLGAAAALVLVAFEDNIVFFYSPSDLVEKSVRPGQTLRLGGLVVEGSVKLAADGIQKRSELTQYKYLTARTYTKRQRRRNICHRTTGRLDRSIVCSKT